MSGAISSELKDSARKLKNVPSAIFKPITTFKNLSKTFPFILIVSLFFFRVLHTLGHYGIIHFQSSQQYIASYGFSGWLGNFFRPLRALHFIYLFMLASVAIYWVGKKLGNEMDYNYETVEEGIFYTMMTPILLLFIFGIPHLWFDPAHYGWYIWGVCAHIPLFITFLLMPLQGSCLLKKVWGLNKKYGFPLFLAIPIWVKYRPSIYQALGVSGVRNEFFALVSIAIVLVFYWKESKWKRFSLLLLLFVFAVVVLRPFHFQ